MVQKVISITTIFLVLITSFIRVNASSSVAINDLVNTPDLYDQKTLTIEAEVLGEVLERGEYSWINVKDPSNTIGIYLKTSQTESLKVFGDYFHTGDIVRVQGVFYRACEEHGGEMDLHASSFTVIKQGTTRIEDVNPMRATIALILFAIALMFGFRYFSYIDMMRKQRKQQIDTTL